METRAPSAEMYASISCDNMHTNRAVGTSQGKYPHVMAGASLSNSASGVARSSHALTVASESAQLVATESSSRPPILKALSRQVSQATSYGRRQAVSGATATLFRDRVT